MCVVASLNLPEAIFALPSPPSFLPSTSRHFFSLRFEAGYAPDVLADDVCDPLRLPDFESNISEVEMIPLLSPTKASRLFTFPD